MRWLIKEMIGPNFLARSFGEVYVAAGYFSEYMAAYGHVYYHFANFGRHYYEIDRQEVPKDVFELAVSMVITKIETSMS